MCFFPWLSPWSYKLPENRAVSVVFSCIKQQLGDCHSECSLSIFPWSGVTSAPSTIRSSYPMLGYIWLLVFTAVYIPCLASCQNILLVSGCWELLHKPWTSHVRNPWLKTSIMTSPSQAQLSSRHHLLSSSWAHRHYSIFFPCVKS